MKSTTTFSRYLAPFALAALFAATLQAAPPRADEPHTPPRVSPLGQAAQVVGITGISVTYGRPAVKERKIWGGLEPLGKVWRTGANDATVITFSGDVEVEGEKLAAGTYGLFTIPGEDEWSVIFNEDYRQWGAFTYDEEKDVLRVKVKPQPAVHQERFTIDFPEVGDEETVMRLRWDEVAVPVTIRAPVDQDALIARARAAADDGVNHLWEWTAYLVSQDVGIPEMELWARKINEAVPGYYTTNLRATVLAALGKTEEAIATGEKALELGEQELGKNQFLTQDQLDKLVQTLEEWRNARVAGAP